MKYYILIILTFFVYAVNAFELAGTSLQSELIHIKTRNGERINNHVSVSYGFEQNDYFDNKLQLMECKLSKSISNKLSFLQYNIAIYQGLFETKSSGNLNGIYDFAGINGSIDAALKLSIYRVEICYGVTLGCIMEAGDYSNFIDQATESHNSPYQFNSGGFGCWNFHLSDDSYFSIQSSSNTNGVYKTTLLFQTQDAGYWVGFGQVEYFYEDDDYFGYEYDFESESTFFSAGFSWKLN